MDHAAVNAKLDGDEEKKENQEDVRRQISGAASKREEKVQEKEISNETKARTPHKAKIP